jgi:hypothetical protein
MGWPAQLLASPILFLCGPGGALALDRSRSSSPFYEFVPEAARGYTRADKKGKPS